jgi:hypothetical protein
MALHEMHETAEGGSIRVTIRRPKRDRKIRRGEERPLPHLGNKQKHPLSKSDSTFTTQAVVEPQTTPVDESTNQTQTQPFFTTQESTMTQATTQTEQAAQATTPDQDHDFVGFKMAEDIIKQQMKEAEAAKKEEKKSSAWKTAGKVVGGIAAVAGLAAGGYFAWKKYGSS